MVTVEATGVQSSGVSGRTRVHVVGRGTSVESAVEAVRAHGYEDVHVVSVREGV